MAILTVEEARTLIEHDLILKANTGEVYWRASYHSAKKGEVAFHPGSPTTGFYGISSDTFCSAFDTEKEYRICTWDNPPWESRPPILDDYNQELSRRGAQAIREQKERERLEEILPSKSDTAWLYRTAKKLKRKGGSFRVFFRGEQG